MFFKKEQKIKKSINLRTVTFIIIKDILKRKSSLIFLSEKIESYKLEGQSKKMVFLICYGFFRHYFYLNRVLESLSKKKTKNRIKNMILIGLYQLIFTEKGINHPHAIVNETLKAAHELKFNVRCIGFMNVIFRNINLKSLPRKDQFLELPSWIVKKLLNYYKETEAISIISNINKKAPTFLRINQQRNFTDILRILDVNEIQYKKTDIPHCLRINDNYSNSIIKNHIENGNISIQDLSAQYAAHILSPGKKERILDVCAAPGGKSTHLLEKCPRIHLSIIDISEKRLSRLRDNIKRLDQKDLDINYYHKNAENDLKIDHVYDKILIDSPCSGTGVIRRKPDIKVLRTEEEVENICKIQQSILRNIWQYLKKDGKLLYITCSILEEENEKQIEKFIKYQEDAYVKKIENMPVHQLKHGGYQLLTSQEYQGDGFYYCLLERRRKTKG